MYPRSEFPTERLPNIIGANGRINKGAIAMRFSAAGCPNAKTAIVVAALKAGHTLPTAFKLAILAYYMDALDVSSLERTTVAVMRSIELLHAAKFPNGKSAEDIAARRDGRPSRWGTAGFRGVQA